MENKKPKTMYDESDPEVVFDEWVDGELNVVMRKKDKNTGEHFYISYNPYTNLLPAWAAGAGKETSLATIPDDENQPGCDHYVLNGDFREEYEKVETLKEALDVYNKHKDKHRSEWSTD